jgi:quercetin dioxygenase-like cupin family protein
VFTVLDGAGFVFDGDERLEVSTGDVVHVLPGRSRGLEAAAGTFTVLGVRRLTGGRRG